MGGRGQPSEMYVDVGVVKQLQDLLPRLLATSDHALPPLLHYRGDVLLDRLGFHQGAPTGTPLLPPALLQVRLLARLRLLPAGTCGAQVHESQRNSTVS